MSGPSGVNSSNQNPNTLYGFGIPTSEEKKSNSTRSRISEISSQALPSRVSNTLQSLSITSDFSSSSSSSSSQHSSASFLYSYRLLGKMNDTEELAQFLRMGNPKEKAYFSAQKLALDIIDRFSRMKVKSAHIAEVLLLASSKDHHVCVALIKAFIETIKTEPVLDFHNLKALRTSIENSPINALDATSLFEMLKIIHGKFDELKKVGHSRSKRLEIIDTLAGIFDAMGDANVTGLERITTQEPLYDDLEKLSKSADFLEASLASYAKLALLRVPKDETKFSSRLRRLIAAGKGVSGLINVVRDKDPSKLMEAFGNLKEALYTQDSRERWADELRMVKFFIVGEYYNECKLFIEKYAIQLGQRSAAGCSIHMMNQIALYHPEMRVRFLAIDSLAEIFLYNKKWGFEELAKEAAIKVLGELGSHTDKKIRDYARKVLKDFDLSILPIEHIGYLTKSFPSNLSITPNNPILAPGPLTNELFQLSYRNRYVSLEEKLGAWREEVIYEYDAHLESICYVEASGAESIYDPKINPFNLSDEIDKFLAGDKKVFLLLGDSGAGKSSFIKALTRRLWKEWNKNKHVPILIELGSSNAGVGEVLKRFTEHEINELKLKYKIFFLFDGVDESKQRRNLFEVNELDQWNSDSKVIFTCKTQYFLGELSSYQKYFIPLAQNASSKKTPIREAVVSPFTTDKIKAYCKLKKSIPDASKHLEKALELIPELKSLIENPQMLSFVVEHLQDLIRDFQSAGAKQILSRFSLMDRSINSWLNDQSGRMGSEGIWTEEVDLEMLFVDFAKLAAEEMVVKGLSSLNHNECIDIIVRALRRSAPFIKSDDSIRTIRFGIPVIGKKGPNAFNFLHRSFQWYFYTKAVFPFLGDATQTTKTISVDMLEKKCISEEFELVNFLAECVCNHPEVKDSLFKLVERSRGAKTETSAAIAGSNAITILNAAGTDLSFLNLNRISIPNANLVGVRMAHSKLIGSNLTNVKMHDAFLNFSTIARSSTAGLELGQGPFFAKPEYDLIAISTNGKRVLGMTKEKGLNDNEFCLTVIDVESEKELINSKFDLPQVVSYSELGRVASLSEDSQRVILLCVDKNNHRKNYAVLLDLPGAKTLFCVPIDHLLLPQFSPDGKTILVMEEGKSSVDIRSAMNGNLTCSIPTNGSPVVCIGMDRLRNRFVIIPGDGTICFLNTSSGVQEHMFRVNENTSQTKGVIFSNDHEKMIIYSSDTIYIRDSISGNLLISWTVPLDSMIDKELAKVRLAGLTCLAFSDDDKIVVSGDSKGTISLWEVKSGKMVASYSTGNGILCSDVGFASNRYALSLDKKAIRYWNTHELMTLPHRGAGKSSLGNFDKVVLSANGSRLFWRHNDRTVIWDIPSNRELLSEQTGLIGLAGFAFFDNGRKAISVDQASISIWEVDEVKVLHKFKWNLKNNQLERIYVSTDQKRILFHISKEHYKEVIAANFSFEVFEKAVKNFDSFIYLIDLETKEQKRKLKTKGSGQNLAISNDGKLAVEKHLNNSFSIYNIESETKIYESASSEKTIVGVTFLPNSTQFIILYYDKITKNSSFERWDSQPAQLLLSKTSKDDLNAGNSINLVFSADGKTMLSWLPGMVLSIWDSRDGNLVRSCKLPSTFDRIADQFVFQDNDIVFFALEPTYQLWTLNIDRMSLKPGLVLGYPSGLHAQNLDIIGTDLSSTNRKLLLQHGAKDEQEEKSLYNYEAVDLIGNDDEECASSDEVKTNNKSDDDLNTLGGVGPACVIC